MAPLKLVSLNIDGRNNLDRASLFLAEQKPDVAYLYEMYEADMQKIAGLFADQDFVPMTRRHESNGAFVVGFGIFYGEKIRRRTLQTVYYVGGETLEIMDIDETTPEGRARTIKRAVAFCYLEKDDVIYKIGGTHFTWTPDGKPNEDQRKDIRRLMPILNSSGEYVLCGDFNAPRGGVIFGKIANRLTDNIPPTYETSLDPDLHKVRGLQAMVDGLFSTSGYRVTDVGLTFGVSDHAGVSGLVTRK